MGGRVDRRLQREGSGGGELALEERGGPRCAPPLPPLFAEALPNLEWLILTNNKLTNLAVSGVQGGVGVWGGGGGAGQRGARGESVVVQPSPPRARARLCAPPAS